MQRQGGLDPQLRPAAVTACHKTGLGKVSPARAAPGSGGRDRGSFPVGSCGGCGETAQLPGQAGQNVTTGRGTESCFSSCLVTLLNKARKKKH